MDDLDIEEIDERDCGVKRVLCLYTQWEALSCKHTRVGGREDVFLMLDWPVEPEKKKTQRHKCLSSCDWPLYWLDFALFDYWLVTVRAVWWRVITELPLEADAKSSLSRLKSDAYPSELTGAVSVNFLFIEQAPSQRLKDNVTWYLMHQ